jgi:hypothetical protein
MDHLRQVPKSRYAQRSLVEEDTDASFAGELSSVGHRRSLEAQNSDQPAERGGCPNSCLISWVPEI